MNITFYKASKKDKALITRWWNAPHVKEFWDNSPEMWMNVEKYLDQGVNDIFDYWVGYYNDVPFSLVMTSLIDEDAPGIYYAHSDGVTYSIDFMIGDESYLGKGLAAPTLRAFMNYCPAEVSCYLIDPAAENVRAVHVYSKAGFVEIDRFTPEEGSFKNKEHIMMRCIRDVTY